MLGTNLSIPQQAFHSEAITWKHLRHRNIVPFLGICDMSPVCFVSEWMEEGTLLGFLERHPGEPRTGYVSFLRASSSRYYLSTMM
jgi:hypothetical protein